MAEGPESREGEEEMMQMEADEGPPPPAKLLPNHLERVLAANRQQGSMPALLLCAVHAAMLEAGFTPETQQQV